MMGKRPHPVIGRLSALLVPGNRTGFSDSGLSPRGPLDFIKIQSPRGFKNYDVGGVGLGIVAALEKSSNDRQNEIPSKLAICSPNLNRSNPIPVKNSGRCRIRDCEDLETEESLENYTFVTRRGNGGDDVKSVTKVFYDGDENKKISDVENGRTKSGFNGNSSSTSISGIGVMEDSSIYPTSDFLSCCDWCRKKLHGRDIYMYRGEKAFCSTECRSSQIMMDERTEKCRTEASRSADLSSSPYTRDQIFSTGILAI